TSVEPSDSLDSLPDCDVLIYPSRRLGDMVRSELIYELSDAVMNVDAEDSEGTYLPLVGSSKAQATNSGKLFAVPLGQSLTQIVGNDALQKVLTEEISEERTVTWDSVIAALGDAEASTPAGEMEFDSEALVDRFLAIAASQVSKNPSYGLLFELQTMQSLLHGEEFVRAASILKQLAQAANAKQAVFGSHDQAWSWATSGDEPRVGILTLTKLSKAVSMSGEGVALQIAGEKAMTWDTGDGLLASLSIHCRQTAQGTDFLKWLREKQTRRSLADWVVGVDSGLGNATASTLLQDAYRMQADWRGGTAVPREPSLPRTHRFRELLAEQLVKIVEGEVTPSEGMKAASDRWTELAKNEGARLRKEYENSLGLGY
ncbi:MAG: hypothetical protein AAGG44_08655, partial [Planctomycetota bacterium]